MRADSEAMSRYPRERRWPQTTVSGLGLARGGFIYTVFATSKGHLDRLLNTRYVADTKGWRA